MVAWFIIALATLTIFAFVAVNAATNVTTSYDITSRAITARNMDAAINALLQAADSPNSTGNAWLPAGRTSGSNYILPASLSQYANSGIGQPIIYCPFGGSESGTNATIPSQDGSSYTVQVASINGISYVVGGRPAYAQVSTNSNLLGWLMAARQRTDATPSCDSVTYSTTTNTFSAPNAIVRPIIQSLGPEANRDLSTKAVTWYVSASGSGSGTSASDPASLLTALNYWRLRQPPAMSITFANGSYTIPGSYLDDTAGAFSDLGHMSSLSMTGSVGNVSITQTGGGNIQIPAGNLSITGINFDTATNFVASANAAITMNNSSGGAVLAKNGGLVALTATTLTASNGSVASATNNGTIVMNGTIALNGNASSPVLYADVNSNIDLNSATVAVNLSSGSGGTAVSIADKSMLESNGGSITFGGSFNIGYYLSGATFNATNLAATLNSTTITDFIQAANGASITLNSGSMSGNKPTYGFHDYGAAYLGGSSFSIRGSSACWIAASGAASGVLSQSATPVIGVSTAVQADTSVAALANNNVASIITFVTGNGTNAVRDNMRSSNQSAWICSN